MTAGGINIIIYDTPEAGRTFELLEPLEFTINGRQCTVPAGWVSNGFSCPRWAWPLISPAIDPSTLHSAIVHDYLYATHPCSRKVADLWFRDDLIDRGFPAWKAYAGYYALRVFGASHWRNETTI